MKLRPVAVLNHPGHRVLTGLLSPNADRSIVTATAYQQLLTRYGVSPAKAKSFLGLPSETSAH